MCVFFLDFVRVFYSGISSTYFKVCVDLCKKSDRTRCLAFSILEYNINSKFEVGRASESVLVF